PKIALPKVKAGLRILQKKLGFRYKMDLIPIHGDGVKGSHGRIWTDRGKNPLLVTQQSDKLEKDAIKPTDVYNVIYSHLFD
ncbi:MAG: hypothetical protein WD604_16960, partial [Balneolaceae bacterium]